MESKTLLNRIINHGGLMAACAKLYISDQEKTTQFLKECCECCYTALAENYWGKALVKDIINYNRNYKHEVKHN